METEGKTLNSVYRSPLLPVLFMVMVMPLELRNIFVQNDGPGMHLLAGKSDTAKKF